MKAVAAVNIQKIYGNGTVALEEVSLEVERGTITGLIGPNGAGKSTLINILTTAIDMTSGHASVYGYDVVRERKQVRAVIGVCGQEREIDFTLSVYDNLRFFAGLYGLDNPNGVVKDYLAQFELEYIARRSPMQISGGELRCIQFIRAIMHTPPVLFIDEPTTGLDPVKSELVLEQLIRLKERGVAILFSTHEMNQAQKVCDIVCFLQSSRILYAGTPEEIIRENCLLEQVEIEYEGTLPAQVLKTLSDNYEVERIQPLIISMQRAEQFIDEAAKSILSVSGLKIIDIRIHRPNLDLAFKKIARRKHSTNNRSLA
ncbi:MAG: ABC transporter ATP-binding protein [Chloroflexi bacterium]|nr:ABC transporter ATP-binding protein [Chloroflexota bacterium]